MSEYVKTFNKEKNDKIMSLHIDDEKLLEKYKTIWTKIEALQNIKLNTLPVSDNRYTKTDLRTYCDKFYTNFRDLNVPEDGVVSLNLSDIAIITVKGVDYRCIIHDISKSYPIHLLENPVLDYDGYI